MRYLAVLLTFAIGCTNEPNPSDKTETSVEPNTQETKVQTSATALAPINTWFDPQTAQQIMSARSDFDAAEAAALAELDRTIGRYRNVMMMPRDQYARQLAGPEVAVARSESWRLEQQRRAAYAYSIAEPKIDRARDALSRSTLAILASFFERELNAGRISPSDYRRYTVEIRRGYFPGFRGRKWTGPAVYEFWGADVSPEYRRVLQEVRRLWLAQGRPKSAVVSVATNASFYREMVPRSRR